MVLMHCVLLLNHFLQISINFLWWTESPFHLTCLFKYFIFYSLKSFWINCIDEENSAYICVYMYMHTHTYTLKQSI